MLAYKNRPMLKTQAYFYNVNDIFFCSLTRINYRVSFDYFLLMALYLAMLVMAIWLQSRGKRTYRGRAGEVFTYYKSANGYLKPAVYDSFFFFSFCSVRYLSACAQSSFIRSIIGSFWVQSISHLPHSVHILSRLLSGGIDQCHRRRSMASCGLPLSM